MIIQKGQKAPGSSDIITRQVKIRTKPYAHSLIETDLMVIVSTGTS